MKHVIIDYGAGNIASIMKACHESGLEAVLSHQPDVIKNAESLILPGVGAFKEAMDKLEESGLIPLIKQHVHDDKPFLGICLGMQLLYEKSFEMGEHRGLGFLEGQVVPLETTVKVPHMGWNQLRFSQPGNPLIKTIKENDYVYFVHSYYVQSKDQYLVAYAEYGNVIPAIVQKGRVVGMQFHPEKSGRTGKALLNAYKELIK